MITRSDIEDLSARRDRYGVRRWHDRDGSRIVEMSDPNDNAGRVHQYRFAGGRVERRVLTAGHVRMSDGSPWTPADIRRTPGVYHPIADELGGSWDDVLGIVRGYVGRRWRITRAQAAEIVDRCIAAGVDPFNSCATDITASGWVARVRSITCVSIAPTGDSPHGEIRYDDPGSMHPMQQSALTLTAHAESVPYLRRHARRVLLVDAAQPPPPPEDRGDGPRHPPRLR